jgi:ribosomal protein L37AE/L43A
VSTETNNEIDDDHYCTHCGSDDLAAGELRASGREWTCRQCGNVFQRNGTASGDEGDEVSTDQTLKPCPFCGKQPSPDDPDTLYPSGTGWVERRGLRHYVSFREAPKEQWCYSMNCPEPSGGCGAEIHGDSAEEAMRKWNTRTEPKA